MAIRRNQPLVDDRGRPVKLGASRAADLNDLELGEMRERAARLARSGPSPKPTLGPIGTTIAAVLVLVAVVGLVIAPLLGFDSMLLGGVAIVAFAILYVCAAARKGTDPDQVAIEAMLLVGRCPCCAYPIAGCATEADGRVACPECGAAWLRARIVPRTQNSSPAIRPRSPLRSLLLDLPPLIRDAEGRMLEASNPRLRRLTASQAQRLGHDRAVNLRDEMRWVGKAKAGLLLLLLVPTARAWAVNIDSILRGAPTLEDLLNVVAYPVALATSLRLMWLLGFGRRFLKPQVITQQFLRHRVCPHCIAPLDQLPIDEHRRVRCADCAASWNMATHCAGCDYALDGLSGAAAAHCPECGQAVPTNA